MPPSTNDLLQPPPDGAARRRANLFIALFLLFHLLTPLRYYLGGGGNDERFSWRMFSSVYADQQVRLESCRAAAGETLASGARSAVPLQATVTDVWSAYFRRGRMDVVRGFLRWRCRRSGAREVRLELRCAPPQPSFDSAIDCKSGTIRTAASETWEAGTDTGTAP